MIIEKQTGEHVHSQNKLIEHKSYNIQFHRQFYLY